MNKHEHELDTVLTKLLAGEPVEQLVKEFPGLEREILSHAKAMGNFAQLKTYRPAESGLHSALQSMRTPAATSASAPSPFAFVRFSEYSFIYRSAFVLPILLIILVGSGVYLIPRGGTSDAPLTPTFAPNTQESTTLAQDAGAPSADRTMKTMALTAPAPEPTLPQDTTLAAIYGPEISHDVQVVEEDSAQAASTSDDTSATEGYTNAYDEHSF